MRLVVLLAALGLAAYSTRAVYEPQPGQYARTDSVLAVTGPDEAELVEVGSEVTLTRAGESALQMDLASVQANYHICELHGIAQREGETYVLHAEAEYLPDAPPCRLVIRGSWDGIVLEDANGSCRRIYCGARAGLDGMNLYRVGD